MQRRDELIGRYVACYVLYFILLALGGGVALIWYTTALLLIGVAVGPAESDQFLLASSVVIIVFGLFALFMVAEPYLRTGVKRRELRRRFARLAAIVAGLIVVGVALQEVLRMLPLGSGA